MIEVYDLRRLPEDGETIDETLESSWLARILNEGGDGLMKVKGDGRAKLQLDKVGDDDGGPVVRVHGDVEARIETPCVRCLLELDLAIVCHPDLTLFPASRGVQKDDDEADDEDAEAVDPEQLDEGTYEDHQIDLPGLVREALLLEVMMSPSCAEEEACNRRTQELISSVTPPESPDAVDPRWAALAELRSKIPS
ncbi:MAG: DUF177 domain-containing protein [Myxococcota bacterium]